MDPLEGEASSVSVGYEPVSVTEVLVEMKDTAELAEEVRNLEVDAMQSRFEVWTLRAAADAADPVVLRGLIRLGTSTEAISDAAIDISEGVLRDIEVHPVVQLAVQESDEIITRVEVEPGSNLDGTSVTAGVSEAESTMSVIAIRRPDKSWLLVTDADAELLGGDMQISKGTRTAADAFDELARACLCVLRWVGPGLISLRTRAV